jgi:tetratricopeptide (TPR) repeat protein
MIDTYKPVDVQRAEKYKLSGNNGIEAGKFDKAVECYTQALQLCPSGSNSHIIYSNRLATYLGLERYEDCLDDCERALELKPDYVKAYTHMCWALFYLKDRMDEDSRRNRESMIRQKRRWMGINPRGISIWHIVIGYKW